MTSWRLAREKYPPNVSAGRAGRWNLSGTSVIYTASSLALSALEILASAGRELPDDYVYVRVDIPDDVAVTTLGEDDLPPNWSVNPHSDATRTLGTNWVKSLATVVLNVPSSVIRLERNYIVNPAHPDFARITFSDPMPFTFDDRLKR